MNDPSSFGFDNEQHGEPAPQTGPGYPMPGQYKFSQDELNVLHQCNSESFYKRSLPIATVLGLGTAAAVKRGYLKPNARFGAAPKMTFAVIVGYFMGKVSYQQACAEKLMNLPGSYIGQILRDRKEGRVSTRPPNQMGPPTFYGVKPGDIYSDAGPGNALDLDMDRPYFSDDGYKPTLPQEDSSSQTPPTEGAVVVRPGLSYDELRRRNRGQHADTKQDPYKMEGAPPIVRGRVPPAAPTNKYGDSTE